MKSFIQKYSNLLGLAGVLLVVVVIMSSLSPYFLTVPYMVNAMRFVSEIGLIALGMTVVMLTGGIDISVGAVLALAAVCLGLFNKIGIPPAVSVILVLLIGLAAGFFNGLVITKVGIPAMIVTLATMYLYRGIALGISSGNSFPINENIYFLGAGTVFGIPVQFVILTAAYLVIGLLFRRFNLGLKLTVIGFNEEAARFSGLHITGEKIKVYALSGLFSAMAGIIFACRVTSAKSDYGTGYELDAITMAVLGGASMAGGRVSVLGTLLGTVIIELLRLGMTTANVQSEVQSIIIGAILIAAVALNVIRSKRPSFGLRIKKTQAQ